MSDILHSLTDPKVWAKKRWEYLDQARKCREVLTDPHSHWKYPPTDERVKAAVNSWVNRARNAHAFAMGRKPVIENFLYFGEASTYAGPLYTRQ